INNGLQDVIDLPECLFQPVPDALKPFASLLDGSQHTKLQSLRRAGQSVCLDMLRPDFGNIALQGVKGAWKVLPVDLLCVAMELTKQIRHFGVPIFGVKYRKVKDCADEVLNGRDECVERFDSWFSVLC